MSTLLLRLAAPLQAWGAGAKFDRRETLLMPTKSGVVGLLAAALGRPRTHSMDDLDALLMGVRADQPGEMLRDYHTAQAEKSTYVTNRFYLADAVFLVGLQGDEGQLATLAQALENPAYPLFLGRRACPPTGRVCLGVRSGVPLMDALRQEPWQAGLWYQQRNPALKSLQYTLDVPPGTPGAFFQRDRVLSFDRARRRYGFRSITMGSVALPRAGSWPLHMVDKTEHDAFADWGD